MGNRFWDWRRFGRLLRLCLGLTGAAVAMIFIHDWVLAFLTEAISRQVAIELLIGLEITYGALLTSSLVGTLVLGGIFWQARREHTRRPKVAQGLLLCGACVLSLALAEALAGLRQVPIRAMPSLPMSDPELPTRFAESEKDDDVTIVVVGESSAAGAPYTTWLSVGRIVAWQLGEVIPGMRFRALVLAKPGDTLEGQYRALANLRRRPDAVIVYCGHNEFFSRIASRRQIRQYRDDTRPLVERLDEFARHASPVFGLIQRAADKYRIEIIPSAFLRPPLVDVPAFTPEEFAANLVAFRRRLEAITAFSERVGALPVLVVPPANDAGFEPLRSFLPPETALAEREAFARDFRAAQRLEDSDPELSIEHYRSLMAHYPGFAESHYRLARLLEGCGSWDEAYQQYIAARDLDGMPVRCLTVFQQAYRDVAATHDCALVDGQALFHEIGPHGLLDDSLFNDVMHPALRGHIALATGILKALHARGSFGWPAGVPTPVIDPARCVAHFGLRPSDWKPVCDWGASFYAAAARLRNDPTQCLVKQRAYEEALRRLAAGEPAEALGLPNVGIPMASPSPPTARTLPDLHESTPKPMS
jgi:tetratricopeptide (TPR) repeat protein